MELVSGGVANGAAGAAPTSRMPDTRFCQVDPAVIAIDPAFSGNMLGYS
jgi:hypothetical protein